MIDALRVRRQGGVHVNATRAHAMVRMAALDGSGWGQRRATSAHGGSRMVPIAFSRA